MSTMHCDDTPDLEVVESVLEEVIGVTSRLILPECSSVYILSSIHFVDRRVLKRVMYCSINHREFDF